MLKNAHSTRAFIAFFVTWAFVILTVSGIILYIVPQGRIAYWVHWQLWGLSKEAWGQLHMLFGGLFIVTGVIHLIYNWKPFKQYIASKAKGHWRLKREIVSSLLFTLVVGVLSVADLPPASWVFDLNNWVKDQWVDSREAEPPFGHAEEVSLAGMARRMNMDLTRVEIALQEAGLKYGSVRDSLEAIAVANGTTPMAVYSAFRHLEAAPALPQEGYTPESVEAAFAGTGLGRKSISEVAGSLSLQPAEALARLGAAGINAGPEQTMRDAADAHGLSPIDLLKVILIPGYRP